MASEQERKTLIREDWILLYKFEDFYDSLAEAQPGNQSVAEVEFEQEMLTCCSDATVFLYIKQVLERHRRDRLHPPLITGLLYWLLG